MNNPPEDEITIEDRFFLVEGYELSTLHISRVCNLSRDLIQSWIKLGIVSPEHGQRGRGPMQVFSLRDLYRIALFGAVSRSRMAPKHCTSLANLVDKFFIGDDEQSKRYRFECPYMVLGHRKINGLDVFESRFADSLDNLGTDHGFYIAIQPFFNAIDERLRELTYGTEDPMPPVNHTVVWVDRNISNKDLQEKERQAEEDTLEEHERILDQEENAKG